jgi:hypothetical protein
MHNYLHWLGTRIPGEPICFVMDQFRAHTTDPVFAEAEALEIEIIWIPKGATGQHQSLQRRTFGALKSKGKAKWKYIFAQHSGALCSTQISTELLLQSWDELSESAVVVELDFAESFEEDEESESEGSDGEFELVVNPDVSDDDVSETIGASGGDEDAL